MRFHYDELKMTSIENITSYKFIKKSFKFIEKDYYNTQSCTQMRRGFCFIYEFIRFWNDNLA